MVQFPHGWKRTPESKRKNGKFKISFGRARTLIVDELRRIGGIDPRVECDGELRLDGMPRSRSREPEDPGVVAYWTRAGVKYAIACDTYTDRVQNMRAISLTLKAKRDATRWGCASAEAEYKGYEALPPASDETLRRAAQALGGDGGVFTPFNAQRTEEQPWEVLQVSAGASKGVVDAAFRDLVKTAHPDHGGSTEAFARLTKARADMHKLIAQRDEPVML